MLELVIAITVMGLLVAFATPKLRSIRERNNLRGARNQLAAMLGTARAAAIQKGREARFEISGSDATGHVVAVTVDTSAGVTAPLVVVAKRNLKDEFGAKVKVRKLVDTIVPFDPRGFAKTKSDGTAIYSITVPGGGTDSLCVSRYGLIAKRECL